MPHMDGVPDGLQDVHWRTLEQEGLGVVLADKRVVSEDPHGYRRKGVQERGAPVCKRGYSSSIRLLYCSAVIRFFNSASSEIATAIIQPPP